MSEQQADPAGAPADPELEAALKEVLGIVLKRHTLTANQILTLASELQRLSVHRLVEEHLGRFQRRRDSAPD